MPRSSLRVPRRPRSARLALFAPFALVTSVIAVLAGCGGSDATPAPGVDAAPGADATLDSSAPEVGDDASDATDVIDATDDASDAGDPGDPGDAGDASDAGDPGDAGDASETAPPASSETCPATFAACAPLAGTTEFVRLRGTVVTPATALCDGEVLYSSKSGKIVCVDADCSAAPEADGAQIACANGVIFPGLIDPHQHADYDHLPVFKHTKHYDNRNTWRNHEPLYADFKIPHKDFGSTVRANQILAERWAEARIVLSGGTAISGSAGNLLTAPELGGWVRNLDSTSSAVSGLVPNVYADPDTDAVLVSTGTGAPAAATTATHLATIVTRMADVKYRAYLPHLAEGIDVNARLEFDEALKDGVIGAKTSIIHCVGCSTPQISTLAKVGGRLIWSPRSNVDLYGQTANVTVFKALGVTIALGVDWTPSGSLNPIGELQCASHLNDVYFDHAFSDPELVAMSTRNAAAAVGMSDLIGSLKPGLLADLTVVAGDRTQPFRALLQARPEQIRLVVIGGMAVYGDPDVLTGAVLGTNACIPVPDGLSPGGLSGVCGVAKQVCTANDDLASLQSTVSGLLATDQAADAACSATPTTGSYCYGYQLFPLFRCDGLPELDRCAFGHEAIPRRAQAGTTIAAVSGVPLPGTDDDGDGVPNALDDCPKVFNPPFDLATAQEDVDGDGLGDACDPQPCTRADGTDACP